MDCLCVHSSRSGTKRAVNSQNVRSPKLRSPKELSPGIPRRPTAPRETRANVPGAEGSRHGTGMPRSMVEHRVPAGNVIKASQAPWHQQRDSVQRQDASHTSAANGRRATINSEKFARSQLQVNVITNCCKSQDFRSGIVLPNSCFL